MSFLFGKFFSGIQKDSLENLAQKQILKTLSQNDRVLLTSGEAFISPEKEAGFAIWGRLESAGFYDGKVEETFPEDHWFMKQLILYLQGQTSPSRCEIRPH